LGRIFKIRIYHNSLKYLLDQKLTFHSQHLWLSKLLGLDYKIEYRKGNENIVVEALSRVFSSELNAFIVLSIYTNLMDRIKKI
jgi:hypothetical protein